MRQSLGSTILVLPVCSLSIGPHLVEITASLLRLVLICEPFSSPGVIYCTDQAMANGFTYGNEEWANLGQGTPEAGELPDAPPRINSLWIPTEAHEYAPTAGVKFREAVANLYNAKYRQGKESKCTYENVCVVPGGRASLSRVAAVIGDVYVGYQVPEYTTYSENDYKLHIDQIGRYIRPRSLCGCGLESAKPNGSGCHGEDLDKLLHLCKPHTTVILDEVEHAVYSRKERNTVNPCPPLHVNEDPVVIINGLTKNSRLPGWRTFWVIGPKNLISALSQSGSFLDGGANHPSLPSHSLSPPELEKRRREIFPEMFCACTDLNEQSVDCAAEKHFHMKCQPQMGLPVKTPPVATFYIWLDLSDLPNPLNNGLTFFEVLLKEKTVVVPGIFFEINPAHRRDLFSSPCHPFVRISFGPPLADLDKGLDAIERVLERAREEGMITFGHSYFRTKGTSVVHHCGTGRASRNFRVCALRPTIKNQVVACTLPADCALKKQQGEHSQQHIEDFAAPAAETTKEAVEEDIGLRDLHQYRHEAFRDTKRR
ncbi:hypothetical protein BS47DRAFT_1362478 [Hydnum rufescens UP504]|uniref:Aminotransferase class I/classII large domain-containing protein n=1 Tax=Hydnum rufescens UP504 TaxID=1448309 RepID=A0A9P6DTM6_9AGAM|nr:hypothetical protein BS47DRAFT_1362478 [Hydnum rufescens UP504]